MSSAEFSRRLANLIRIGTVAEIDHAAARCRVSSGKLNTNWLSWIALRAGATRSWSPPTVGEQVLIFSPSGEPAAGIVLTGLYSDGKPAPSASPDEHITVFPDGARIAYNHATGALDVTGIKTATIEASEHCTVDCPESTFTGNVLIEGNLRVKGTAIIEQLLTYLAGMAGQGGSGGGGTTISGPITHSSGALSSNGVVVHTHTHPDPQGGNTGGPQ